MMLLVMIALMYVQAKIMRAKKGTPLEQKTKYNYNKKIYVTLGHRSVTAKNDHFSFAKA